MTRGEEESVAPPPGKGDGVAEPEAKSGVGVVVALDEGVGVGAPDSEAIPDALRLGLKDKVPRALPLLCTDALKGGVVEGVWELVVV